MSFDGFELPRQEPCFFCEIVRNGGPDDFVQETDAAIARVNPRQFLEGQCIVISRRHAPTMFDLTDSELVEILRLARRVGRALSTAVKAEGLLIYQNNGTASLQEVPHYHLHLVPQWNSATPQGKFPPHIARSEGIRWEKATPTWLTPEQTGSITAKIRANLEPST